MFLLILYFQQKLILPTLCTSIAVGVAGYLMLWSTPIARGTGFGYVFAGLISHYFIYELRYPNEYYFYFNAGLSKSILYGSTLTLNLVIGMLTLYYE
jgi:hypothetical protein